MGQRRAGGRPAAGLRNDAGRARRQLQIRLAAQGRDGHYDRCQGGQSGRDGRRYDRRRADLRADDGGQRAARLVLGRNADERPALQGGRRRQGRSGGCEGGLSAGRFDRAGGRRDGRHAGVGADVRHRAGALRGDRGFGAAHRRRGYGDTRGIARSEGAPRRDERQPCGADPFGAGCHGGVQRHRSVGHAVELYRLSPARPNAARAARRPFVAARSQRTAGRRFGGFGRYRCGRRSGRYGGDACRRRAAEPRSGTRCVAEKDTVSENGARRFHRFADRGEGDCIDEPAGDECLRRPDVGFGQLLDGSRRAAAGVEVEGRDRRCVVLDDLRPAGRRAPHGAPVREDGRGLLDVARSGDPPDADDGSRLCDLAGRRGDPFEEHPRAEYRRLRPVGRSAQKRRPAPHRGEGCRHPFHDPRRTHRHAALRSERGRYFAQPVGFDGAGSDDRLHGPGDAARRIGGRYSYGGRRRHRRQFLVAEDHARREECREGRREQCDR